MDIIHDNFLCIFKTGRFNIGLIKSLVAIELWVKAFILFTRLKINAGVLLPSVNGQNANNRNASDDQD